MKPAFRTSLPRLGVGISAAAVAACCVAGSAVPAHASPQLPAAGSEVQVSWWFIRR